MITGCSVSVWGLELERFPKAAEELRGKLRGRFGLGPELTLVAIVARMVPIKRHDVFLRAVAKVYKDYPKRTFLDCRRWFHAP